MSAQPVCSLATLMITGKGFNVLSTVTDLLWVITRPICQFVTAERYNVSGDGHSCPASGSRNGFPVFSHVLPETLHAVTGAMIKLRQGVIN